VNVSKTPFSGLSDRDPSQLYLGQLRGEVFRMPFVDYTLLIILVIILLNEIEHLERLKHTLNQIIIRYRQLM